MDLCNSANQVNCCGNRLDACESAHLAVRPARCSRLLLIVSAGHPHAHVCLLLASGALQRRGRFCGCRLRRAGNGHTCLAGARCGSRGQFQPTGKTVSVQRSGCCGDGDNACQRSARRVHLRAVRLIRSGVNRPLRRNRPERGLATIRPIPGAKTNDGTDVGASEHRKLDRANFEALLCCSACFVVQMQFTTSAFWLLCLCCLTMRSVT